MITSSGAFSVAENTAADTTSFALSATDADDAAGGELTWTIVAGNQAARFEFIDGTQTAAGLTAALKFKDAETLDHETQETNRVTVQVSDGEMIVMQTVTVTVTDIDEEPTTDYAVNAFAQKVFTNSVTKVPLGELFSDPEVATPTGVRATTADAAKVTATAGDVEVSITGVEETTTPVIVTVTATYGAHQITAMIAVTVNEGASAEEMETQEIAVDQFVGAAAGALSQVITARFDSPAPPVNVGGAQTSLAWLEKSCADERCEFNLADALRKNQLAFSFGGDGERALTFWAQGAVGRFDGELQGGEKYDGEYDGFYLGADTAVGENVYGVVLAKTDGELDYTAPNQLVDKLQTEIIGASAYAKWAGDATTIWASAGLGDGEIKIGGETADLETRAFAFGVTLPTDHLAWKTQASYTKAQSDGVDGVLGEIDTTAWQIKSAVDSQYAKRLQRGRFYWRTRFGLRAEGGDAQRAFRNQNIGYGGDFGLALGYAGDDGFSADLHAEQLAFHSEEKNEWNASVTLAKKSAARGLAYSLRPTFGAQNDLAMRVDYAMDIRGRAGLFIPFGEFARGDSGGAENTFGARFQMPTRALQNLQLEMSAAQTQTDNRINLRAKLNF